MASLAKPRNLLERLKVDSDRVVFRWQGKVESFGTDVEQAIRECKKWQLHDKGLLHLLLFLLYPTLWVLRHVRHRTVRLRQSVEHRNAKRFNADEFLKARDEAYQENPEGWDRFWDAWHQRELANHLRGQPINEHGHQALKEAFANFNFAGVEAWWGNRHEFVPPPWRNSYFSMFRSLKVVNINPKNPEPQKVEPNDYLGISEPRIIGACLHFKTKVDGEWKWFAWISETGGAKLNPYFVLEQDATVIEPLKQLVIQVRRGYFQGMTPEARKEHEPMIEIMEDEFPDSPEAAKRWLEIWGAICDYHSPFEGVPNYRSPHPEIYKKAESKEEVAA